jgi:hypothetical protein
MPNRNSDSVTFQQRYDRKQAEADGRLMVEDGGNPHDDALLMTLNGESQEPSLVPHATFFADNIGNYTEESKDQITTTTPDVTP